MNPANHPTILARTTTGTPIQGPDCVKHPSCVSLIRRFLDFGESDAVDGFNVPAVRFSKRQFHDAWRRVVVALRANRRRRNQLLDEEYELVRPPMPSEILEARRKLVPLFIPSISRHSSATGLSEDDEADAPAPATGFREIFLTRTVGHPPPEVINPIIDEIESSRGEYHAMWELLAFFWRCRNAVFVAVEIR